MPIPDASTFRPADFFVLRTPLLSFDTLLEWADGLTLPPSHISPTESSIADNADELVVRLRSLVRRPEIREAILLASPSTYAAMLRWLDAPHAKDDKLEYALIRYLQRMCGRATPFGLFAACSLGIASERTDLVVGSLADARRHSRLDNEYLFALNEQLRSDPSIRRATIYRPNTSLYSIYGHWRYARATRTQFGHRYDLCDTLDTQHLTAAIAAARDGASFVELIGAVTTACGSDISEDDAACYVEDLIADQVLVPHFAPLVTGDEPLAQLIRDLISTRVADDAVAILRRAQQQLADIDRAPLGIDVGKYELTRDTLAKFPVSIHPSHLFQVDLFKPLPQPTYGRRLAVELAFAADVLRRVCVDMTSESLRQFKQAFLTRYDAREVRLVDALDEETGIGFGFAVSPQAEHAPLLDGLAFPPLEDPAARAWTPRDAFLLSKLHDTWTSGDTVLPLSAQDLDRLCGANPLQLPDAFCLLASVATSSPVDLEADFEIYVRGAFGPSGVHPLGRFCHGSSEIHAHVRSWLEIEEAMRPDAILTEIVHLPEGRVGNIVVRPVLRRYEIPYLGRSGAHPDCQIPISDLLLSVRDDRLVLRSERFAAEIIPRMTTAHYSGQGMSLYRFLCSMQVQSGTPAVTWTWGSLDDAPFLPRVTFGRVVLARARWRLDRARIALMTSGLLSQRYFEMHRWRVEYRVPRFVLLADGEHELPVDLDNVLSVTTFLRLVTRRNSCVLLEMFPDPHRLAAHGAEGRFVHEIMMPFAAGRVSAVNHVVPARVKPAAAAPLVRRSFPPGSEWLYLKLYAGTATVDLILTERLGDLLSQYVDEAAVTDWFFVRYGDPDWHLRLRLHGDSRALQMVVAADVLKVASLLVDSGKVWRVELDTYEREIERYGGSVGIALSERLFWRDSEAVLDVLRQFTGDDGMEARWRLCICMWDSILSGLGFDLSDKQALVAQHRDKIGANARANTETRRMLDRRFRDERRSLEDLLDGRENPLRACIHERFKTLEPVLQLLRRHYQDGTLPASLQSLAVSYLHMHANRILRSSHRTQEFVMADLLSRYYESKLARHRKRTQGWTID